MSNSNKKRLEQISTHWSQVQQAHQGTGGEARQARHTLVLRYLPAVKEYVQAMIGNEQDANDVSQELALKLLKGSFAGVQPERGRFRSYLKGAIRNTVRDWWDKKKRTAAAKAKMELLSKEEQADDPWTSLWQRTLLDQVWFALQAYEQNHAGSVAYTLLQLHLKHQEDDSPALARRLSAKTGRSYNAPAVRQQLHRAREKFAQLLIEEVARSLDQPTPEAIDAELAELGLGAYLTAE